MVVQPKCATAGCDDVRFRRLYHERDLGRPAVPSVERIGVAKEKSFSLMLGARKIWRRTLGWRNFQDRA